MRIDFDERTIACSVGDLIYDAGNRRLGVERGDGFRRMWIGQEIHSRRADERAGADPHYRPEVTVTHQCTVSGWSVTVSGRIDGLSVHDDRKLVEIEEVKSVHFELELAGLYRSEKLQRHLYQLMLYAYFLSLQSRYEEYQFLPQLVVIDLVTGNTKLIDAPFDRDDVASALQASLESMVEGIEARVALRKAKSAFAADLAFPFASMRPFQKEMIDSVARTVREKEALLVSAPTGVGKTMAAIYPALRESLRMGKKLFYLTPKTLQQENAVAALDLLNDGSFRVLRIRAKQKMCAHTEVICHEDFCPFAARYSEKMQRSGLLSRIVDDLSYFDPDITFEMSKSEEVCPFEVSLELIEQADVVVCDYNYIFDPYVGLRAYSEESDYGDCVLIIDEAHNLLDRGRGYYSPELLESTLEQVRLHLTGRGCDLDGWDTLLDELQEHLRELSSALESSLAADDGSWSKRAAFQPTQALCEPDRRLFLRQRAAWEQLLIEYVSWKIQQRIAEENDPLIDFYFKLMKLANLLTEEGDEFAQLIERTHDGLKLKIFCKDPSRFIGETIESAHATIAISATLEPFDFYRQTLGFPRDRSSEISLPSPFPAANRKIIIIPEVNTTFKERASHYGTIAENAASIASSADGNFLVLFPSYAFLRQVAERMPTIRKNLLVQRPDMTEYERRSFLSALRESGGDGHVILAVSGGMYAEGIDYQGDMLAGVVVVGPALPSVSFEQELLKRYYDEKYGAGFEYAYLIPGMTRVVQSAGRVIRSENDVGIIALMCKRFTFPQYTKFFPSHWYDSSPRELVVKKPAEEIRRFFDSHRQPQLPIRQLF
ncbi:MAG: ATP-dependent DNA helicase [Acidobacteriota bacterium]